MLVISKKESRQTGGFRCSSYGIDISLKIYSQEDFDRAVKGFTITIQKENTELIKSDLKKCKYCLEIKDLSSYEKVGKTRYSEYCIDCKDTRRKEKSYYDKEYYKHNKDKKKEYYKKWKKSGGQEIRRIHNQKRYSIKKNIENNFTIEDWNYCKYYFNYRCAYCGKEKELTQDHFIPVKDGGGYTVSNIIPACINCNTSKNSKNFFEWYPEQDFYSQERQDKILKYLNHEHLSKKVMVI